MHPYLTIIIIFLVIQILSFYSSKYRKWYTYRSITKFGFWKMINKFILNIYYWLKRPLRVCFYEHFCYYDFLFNLYFIMQGSGWRWNYTQDTYTQKSTQIGWEFGVCHWSISKRWWKCYRNADCLLVALEDLVQVIVLKLAIFSPSLIAFNVRLLSRFGHKFCS